MKIKDLSKLALAGVVTAGLTTLSSQALAAGDKNMEKCHGVVKAGQNDCGAPGKHACAGQAKVDGHGHEWLMVPKGTCQKLVNGSLTPKDEDEE